MTRPPKAICFRGLALFPGQVKIRTVHGRHCIIYIKKDRKETADIKTYTPINIVIHHPQTDAGRKNLAARVAAVHSDAIHHYLDCSSLNEEAFLDAVENMQDEPAGQDGGKSD